MGVKAKFYHPLAENLAKAKVMAITADLRGIGLSSIRPSAQTDFGYLELIEDLKIITDAVKSSFPNRPVYFLGHSLGGQAASLAMAKYPNLAKGLILAAANSVFYKGWSGRQRYLTLMAVSLFPLISKVVGYFPGHKIGFGGKGAKTVMIDWGYVGKNGKYKLQGDAFDYEAALKKMTTPILAIYMEGDWMSPKKAMAYLYEKFNTAAPVSHFTLTTESVGKKLNHFNWVKNSDSLVEEIINWLK